MTSPVRSTLFASALAVLLPLAPLEAQVPAPRDVLGHQPGESGWLAEWSEIGRYMHRLGESSPKVRIERIGTTALGREMLMAVITSEANHARLDEIRAGQARIADPRGVPESEVQRLIATQPAVAFIGASLHGNEIMATQMSMELAHDLATDPELGEALENVVVLLVPGMNPDGLDITRDWWLRTRGTAHEGSPMPWMYHHYVGHDNNRDFFMVTQPETKAVTEVLYRQWFPQVVYDVHQMGNRGARFFIPPFADPLNPNLDPLLVRQTNLVGVQMALDLTAAGKTGVSHQQTFDLWWHGGGRTVPARHNMVGILSEAASAAYGDPIEQSPDELRQPELGSMFPEPWDGGAWTPRDIVEYELIAAKSLVGLLDRQRDRFVGNMVELARRQIERGAAGEPFAFVLPADQRDPGSAAELANVLMRGGVEVHRATIPITADGQTFPAGSWVVLMAQPFRAHAKDLLEPQRYPERRAYPGGPPIPPYDLAGWTLSMQMGVDAVPVAEPFGTAALAQVDSAVVPAGRVAGRGASSAALDPRLNASHRAIHEVLGAGGRVTFAARPVAADGETWPAGTPVVSGVADLDQRAARWAREWGVNAVMSGNAAAGRAVEGLRVGLYKPWTASMDEGWTRWMFEQWEVPFDTVKDARMRQGDLARDFDVIVVPDMSHRQMIEGLSPERSPAEYAGGLGEAGTEALRAFVRGGGTLVLLDSSSEFAIEELDVPVTDVAAAQDDEDPNRWYAPGSLLRVRWNDDHPVTTGMPDETAVFYARSPVFRVSPGARGVTVLASYPESDVLLSGYAQGESEIVGQAAAVAAQVGQGQVVMFGFRPQHRAQPHETFKPLFNALYLQ